MRNLHFLLLYPLCPILESITNGKTDRVKGGHRPA